MSRADVANAWLKGYKSPSERATEMARLYAEGLTLAEIGERYNLSSERVRQLIKPFGITPNYRRLAKSRTRDALLRDAHAQIIAGLTTTDIEAKRLGYAKPEYLRMAFWRMGLHLRKATNMTESEKRQAARNRYLARVARGPKKHGTVSSYKNFGCRCPKCRSANRKYERELRRNRRAKEADE